MKRALFFGLATLDIQYYVDQFPSGNIKVKADPPEFFVGGPSTNAAVAFAALNGRSHLVTAIGESAFKSHFNEDFEKCKVSFWDLLQDQKQQPVLATVVTSGNGDRTIFSHHPNPIVKQVDVCRLFDEIQPEIVMTDGFYPEVAIPVCQEAQKRNIPVVFDGGSWKDHLPELLPVVDYAICSNDFIPPGCQNPEEIIDFLNQYHIPYKAITRGGKDILYASSSKIESIAIPNVDVIDTLGAGDFFHGAFCFYQLTIKSFSQALYMASRFASETCMYKGTRDWLKNVQ